jgi:hypothetical protein
MCTVRPSTVARTPFPGTAVNPLASGASTDRSAAASTVARARWCSERPWTAAASASSRSSVNRSASAASATPASVRRVFPSVSVPVLSNATTSMLAAASTCSPPLNRTPCRPPEAMADSTAAGVEMMTAHGDAATISVIAR